MPNSRLAPRGVGAPSGKSRIRHFLLPPQRSCEKIMFSLVSICLFTGESRVPRGHCGGRVPHPPRHGTSLHGHPPPPLMTCGGHHPTHWSDIGAYSCRTHPTGLQFLLSKSTTAHGFLRLIGQLNNHKINHLHNFGYHS